MIQRRRRLYVAGRGLYYLAPFLPSCYLISSSYCPSLECRPGSMSCDIALVQRSMCKHLLVSTRRWRLFYQSTYDIWNPHVFSSRSYAGSYFCILRCPDLVKTDSSRMIVLLCMIKRHCCVCDVSTAVQGSRLCRSGEEGQDVGAPFRRS